MTGRVDSDMTEKLDATTGPTRPAASSGRGACVTYRTHITIAKTNTTSHSRKYHSVVGRPDGVDPKKTPTAGFRIKYPNMPTNHLAHLRTVTNIAVEAARRPQSPKIR
jgi:hypothetical protein